MRLCCFFNYAPLYRESIFRRLDETYDCHFYFGREVEGHKASGIAKLDYSMFRHRPVEFANVKRGRVLWRRKLLRLAFARYDAYLITWDTCLSYPLFILVAKMLGKKVYAWGHGVKDKTHAGWALDRWMINRLDGFFTYGERGRERMIELGFPAGKIHAIYNSLSGPVDPAGQSALKSDFLRRHFGNDRPTVIFVGRLTAGKQLPLLVEMLVAHRDEGLDYNLLIVGDGPERAALERRARELGVEDRIWLYGECYDERQLDVLIYNSDLCCSPGNVGLTALHAMMYGVPVITHDDFDTQMPEYEIITPGINGDLYRRGDEADMREKVAAWLRSHSDAGSREKARRTCHAAINDRWNSDRQLAVFRSVIR